MEISEILLNRAIDFLDETSISENNWNVGGGTVLSQIYNHRLSKEEEEKMMQESMQGIYDDNEYADDKQIDGGIYT